MEKIITHNTQETQKVAEALAQQIFDKKPGNKAAVLALSGDLGAGKTTFVQGFARGLGVKEKVLSPTFILMKKFKIPNSRPNSKHEVQDKGYTFLYHIDCYRLEKPKEILDVGFREIISNPGNIVVIEWPEKVNKFLIKKTIQIKFNHLEENKRQLIIRH